MCIPRLILLFLFLLLFASFLGCSNSGEDVVSGVEDVETCKSNELCEYQGWMLWGMWDFEIDAVNLTAEAIPIRHSNPHFNVTNMILPPACDDCVSIHVISINPGDQVIQLDVTLHNPTAITGYDVRGIVYTNDTGHELVNGDDWTSLFDIPGGLWLNPFKHFALTPTDSQFAGGASYSEEFFVHYPIPSQFHLVQFAVTASWPGHCKEPYRIDNALQEDPLYNSVGSTATFQVTVWDWQFDVNKVTLVAPEITCEDFTQFAPVGCGVWVVEIEKNTDIPPGEYSERVIASSDNSGSVCLYDFVTITIEDAPECWARTWGGTSNDDIVNDIFTTSSFANYVVGNFSGIVDFDPGAGVETRVSNGGVDAFLCMYDQDGGLNWVRTWGGPEDDAANGVTFHYTDDLYVVGYFQGEVDFDPSSGTQIRDSAGLFDGYISKFDTDGNFEWVQVWGGASVDVPNAVAYDFSGSAYIAGHYLGTPDFDPGPGTDEKPSAGGYDAFVAKYNSDGVYQWVVQIGGPGWEFGYDITQDASNRVFIGGYFSETVDFDPGPGTANRTSAGLGDAFVAVYNQDGSLNFVQTWGGTGYDRCYGVDVGQGGQLFLTGDFEGTADLNPLAGVEEHTSNGGYDVFLIRSAQIDGYFGWAATWGTAGDDYGYSVEGDFYGYSYVVGIFQDTCDFDPGPGIAERTAIGNRDVFLTKFDKDGNHQWAVSFGGVEWDSAQALGLASPDYIFAGGTFNDTVDFDPGSGVDNHTSNGGEDAFLFKARNDGTW